MSTARRSALINVMVDAAEKAGRGLVRDFGEVENLQVSKKGPGDFVSNADLKAEKTIMQSLQKARPKFGFLMEEGGVVKGEDTENTWIIDPLDGTTNFLHGIPHWSISIALERKGELIAGVIYDPVKDELFWAEKGLGAYINNRRLRVAARNNFADSVLGTGYKESPLYIEDVDAVRKDCAGLRRMASAALDLCYVAAGRYDGYWERSVKPWDIAAGAVIAREAGAKVTTVTGEPSVTHGGTILAASPTIHQEIFKRLTDSKVTKK